MKKAPVLTLLIPTYNESEVVEVALRAIGKELGTEASAVTEIIVVDDGTDDLPQKVSAISGAFGFESLRVIRNSPPLGKGKSLARGFEEARGEVVGFMDVDLSTPPRYIRPAVDAIQSGNTDLFIGSRRAPGSRVEREQFWLKDVLGNLLGVIARSIIFTGMPMYQDTQCGFKFYRNGVARILYRDLVAPDGLNDLEVLLRANLIGYKVQEQGVEWSDLRESKRTLRRILVGEMKAILKILWTYKVLAAKQRSQLRVASAKINGPNSRSASIFPKIPSNLSLL